MKETINVSIAGIAFVLDHESYVMLSNYLGQTEILLRTQNSSSELLSDIEARIAEQILSVQDSEHPVSVKTLKPILRQLGGIRSEEDKYEPFTDNNISTNPSIPKRFYRNKEGSVFGGVCSGLASYFNTNVIIFRLLFLLPVFFQVSSFIWSYSDAYWHYLNFGSSLNGTAILIYVILWIVVPLAKTPRQKLEMQGESVTVDSIIREQELGVKYQNRSVTTTTLVSILKIVMIVIGVGLLIGALVTTIAILAKISIELRSIYSPITQAIDIINIPFVWIAIFIVSLNMLPIIAIFYMIVSNFGGRRHSRVITSILWILWFCVLGAGLVVLISHLPELTALDWNQLWHWRY